MYHHWTSLPNYRRQLHSCSLKRNAPWKVVFLLQKCVHRWTLLCSWWYNTTLPRSPDLDPGSQGKPMNSWCVSFKTECKHNELMESKAKSHSGMEQEIPVQFPNPFMMQPREGVFCLPIKFFSRMCLLAGFRSFTNHTANESLSKLSVLSISPLEGTAFTVDSADKSSDALPGICSWVLLHSQSNVIAVSCGYDT